MYKLIHLLRGTIQSVKFACLCVEQPKQHLEHLELTEDLTVNSFLLAFRRFASQWGMPAILITDNAKTVRSVSKEIRNILRSKEVLWYLTSNRITWKFIVKKAPWWGGFWEHLIKRVKRCLKETIGRTTLSQDELSTLVVEVEAVINSRPLGSVAVYPLLILSTAEQSLHLQMQQILKWSVPALPYLREQNTFDIFSSLTISYLFGKS